MNFYLATFITTYTNEKILCYCENNKIKLVLDGDDFHTKLLINMPIENRSNLKILENFNSYKDFQNKYPEYFI